MALAVPTAANAAVPSAPTNVLASPSNGAVTVTWNSSGGGYTGMPGPDDAWMYSVNTYVGGTLVTTGDRGYAAEGPTQSRQVTGLTNGTTYTFKVIGWNGMYAGPYGASSPSAASNATTPFGPPNAPTNAAATAGSGSATVTWNSTDGGFIGGDLAETDAWMYSINTYVGGTLVTTGDRAYAAEGPTQSRKVTGLTNGTTYTFKVIGWNGMYAGPYGASAPSSASNAVTPHVEPNTPTNVAATAGNTAATVTWNSSDGGYTGMAGPDDAWMYSINTYVGGTLVTTGDRGYAAEGATQSRQVTGLTNGVAYTFKVIAWNGMYAGPYNASTASAASNAVTPHI